MKREYHYSPLYVWLGKRVVYDYDKGDRFKEPLSDDERKVLPYLSEVTGTNVDDGTYDACFKSILKAISKNSYGK